MSNRLISKRDYLILFFSGLISGISISSIYLIIFLIVGYHFFISYLDKINNIQYSSLAGLTFGYGYFLGSMHWIIFPFLVYDKHHSLSPLVLILFPLLLAAFYVLAAFLFCIVKKKIKYFYLRISIIAFIFFFTEYLRSTLFGGLPLSLTAHIWAFNNKFISIVSYCGVFGLSFLTLLWLVSISQLYKRKSKKTLLVFITFPILLYLLPISEVEKVTTKEYLVRVIQPNINQKDKWNKNLYQQHLSKLIELTKNKLPEEPIIVVWPEVALPLFLNEEEELLGFLGDIIPDNVILITGSLRRDFSGPLFEIYNSFYILENGETKYYDKVRLVPFGEFIPFKKFLDVLKITPGSTDFSSGKKESILKFSFNGDFITIEPSICYESIFQTFNYGKVEFLINVTNDAWFGKTTGPKQHLAASIFRSVEKGVPLIRSANSGISAIIDKKGKIIKSKKLDVEGYFESKLKVGDNKTIFMKYGNWTLIILLITSLIFGLILDKIFKNRKKD